MTTREWLTKNQDKFKSREDLIVAAMAELGVTRDNVTKRMKLMGLNIPEPEEYEVTPHWKYENMWDRFSEWMGMKERPRTPAKKLTKTVVHGVIACTHAPFQDEEAWREAHRWFKENGVSVIHLAGDVADLYSFSTFTKFESVPIQREAVEARKLVDWCSRNYSEVRIMDGNHEARERKYLARNLPPDLLAWFLEKSFMERITQDMENVTVVRMAVETATAYDLGWISPVGNDLVIGHAEKVTSMIDSLRGVEKFRQWLDSGWTEVLGIARPRFILNAHSHRAGVLPIGDGLICELGCCCKLSAYALSPTKLYGKPQSQAATVFTQVDGVTDINSVRQRYLGR